MNRSQNGSISRLIAQPASRMCFTMAAVAFGASLLGALVSHFLTGWMAVGGMAMVGLLYLGMGLAELTYESTSLSHKRGGTSSVEVTLRPQRRSSEPEQDLASAVDQSKLHWDRISESVLSDA